MKLSGHNITGSSSRLRSANGGFTLIELVIVVVIVAIGVALAVPSYESIVQKRHLTSGTEQIASFLGMVQSEAIKRNEVVVVSIKRSGDGETWCVGAMIKTGADDHCNCESNSPNDGDFCDFDVDGAGTAKLINQEGFRSFTMSDSTPGTDFNFNFDPIRGTKVLDIGGSDTNIHNITLISSNTNYSLRVGMSVTGRVRVCNPDSSKKVPGFKDCA